MTTVIVGANQPAAQPKTRYTLALIASPQGYEAQPNCCAQGALALIGSC